MSSVDEVNEELAQQAMKDMDANCPEAAADAIAKMNDVTFAAFMVKAREWFEMGEWS